MSLKQFLRTYSRANFELLDSMAKYGHCYHRPYHERICMCRAQANKNIAHILFDCQLNICFEFRYLKSLLERTAHWDLNCKLWYFFLVSNVCIVSRNAKFIDNTIQLSISIIFSFYLFYPGNKSCILPSFSLIRLINQ